MDAQRSILAGNRLLSLDAFRGLTIAAMVLVNNPGSQDYVYPPLQHAEWHGWTLSDLIFPFFIFVVGVSISLSLSKRLHVEDKRKKIYLKIYKRTLILFALGIFLALYPHFNFATLRIPGVLQRIALCYLVSSILFIKCSTKGRGIAAFSLLGVYWAVMKLVPVPGYGAGILEFEGNLCGYIDTKIFGNHLYLEGFDPEGLLSTLPAISTTLLGTLAGDWLRLKKRISTTVVGLFGAGIFFTAAGLMLHPSFPINKKLWTSTFVLFTAGVALILLSVLYGIIDGLRAKKWIFPFLIFGTNAIAVYAASSLVNKTLRWIMVFEGGEKISLYTYIYNHFLVPWAGYSLGSLMFPLFCILIWIGLFLPLYRKKIFIKV